MTHKGALIVLSGFSGAGKGTIVKELIHRYDSYVLSVSATTRKPRQNKATGVIEQDGVDYFFVDKERFEEMIDHNELIEYANYRDNYYGTPKAYVEQMLKEGKDVLLEIEVQGAMIIKERYPEAVLIFVTAPSAEELKRRLTGRGTESEEEINGRLTRAREEAEYIHSYDYILVNDDLDTAVQTMHAIVTAEHQHQRNPHLQDFISGFLSELNEITRIG